MSSQTPVQDETVRNVSGALNKFANTLQSIANLLANAQSEFEKVRNYINIIVGLAPLLVNMQSEFNDFLRSLNNLISEYQKLKRENEELKQKLKKAEKDGRRTGSTNEISKKQA